MYIIIRKILKKLVRGELSISDAENLIKLNSIEEVSEIAKLDLNRYARKGIPEIILAEGKIPKDVVDMALKMVEKKERAIISRTNIEHVEIILNTLPDQLICQVNERARLIVIKKKDFIIEKSGGKIGILTAGTSDIAVAEEAKIIAEEMGCEVITAYDVGVAGIHRMLSPLKKMLQEDIGVLVIVAGREGALPSVIAGMIDIPIIGLPTSIGYGFGGKGISALTSMLQACSLGMAVVNIDGGVAAGSVAALIANHIAKSK